MADEPRFAIPARPRREYDRAGRLSYEGSVLFRLEPAASAAVDLEALLENLLETGPYRYGDFHDLPMAVYLVRDDGTGDVFRTSLRGDAIRLHVLPATDSVGLARFYDRLSNISDCEWRVTRQVEGPLD